MTDITELAQLRAELSNPAVGSKDHLRKLALSLVEALEKAQTKITELQQGCENDPRIHEIIDLKERIAELGSRKPDIYLCRVTRNGEDLYSPCGADYPRGTGYHRSVTAESRTVTVKLPVSLDFDCEMENGDYDIDEEPYLRGKVDGFNYALTKVRRLNGTAGIKWEAE